MSILRYTNQKMRARILRGDRPDYITRHRRCDIITAYYVSTPPWSDLVAIAALHARARELTKLTSILHVLGHRFPVTHARVCGLTVPDNLRVVTWLENIRESNHFSETEQEQLILF